MKLKQIDNSAFSTDLKDLANGLLNINYINQLVGEYNTEFLLRGMRSQGKCG